MNQWSKFNLLGGVSGAETFFGTPNITSRFPGFSHAKSTPPDSELKLRDARKTFWLRTKHLDFGNRRPDHDRDIRSSDNGGTNTSALSVFVAVRVCLCAYSCVLTYSCVLHGWERVGTCVSVKWNGNGSVGGRHRKAVRLISILHRYIGLYSQTRIRTRLLNTSMAVWANQWTDHYYYCIKSWNPYLTNDYVSGKPRSKWARRHLWTDKVYINFTVF